MKKIFLLVLLISISSCKTESKKDTVADANAQLEKDIETMKATVAKAELLAAEAEKLDSKLKTINREIQDLWDGMDYLSNPLK